MAVKGTNTILFKPKLDNSNLIKGVAQAKNLIKGLAKTVLKSNPYTAIASMAAEAFEKVAEEAYKLAKEYQHAMKKVETISKATQSNFYAISSRVFELSKVSLDGPVALAEAYYEIVAAGHDGAEGIKVLETALKAAVGGVTSTTAAAKGLTTVLNAWKLNAEQVNEVSDVLFTTVEHGNTTFEQLSSSIGKVAPLAASSGVELKEVAAAVAILTKQGVPTAQAITQIRSAIEGLNNNLGYGWAEAHNFQQALELMSQKAGGSQGKLEELLGSSEAVSTALALTGVNATEATIHFEYMSRTAGATAEAHKTAAESASYQWALFDEKIKNLTAFESFGGVLAFLSTNVAKFFNFVLGGTKQTVIDTNSINYEVDKYRANIQGLILELGSLSEEDKRRSEIIQEIQNKYPKFIGNIDLEKATNEELISILNRVNQAHEKRRQFEKIKAPLESAGKVKIDAEIDLGRLISDRAKLIAEVNTIFEDNGINIKIDIEESLEDQKSKIKNGFKKISEQSFNGVGGAQTTTVSGKTFTVGTFEAKTDQNYIKSLTSFYKGIDLATQNTEISTYRYSTILKAFATETKELYDSIYKISDAKEIIENSKSLDELKVFESFDTTEISKLASAQIKVVEDFEKVKSKISQITKGDFKNNQDAFKAYIESENRLISEFAAKRKKELDVNIVRKPKPRELTELELFERDDIDAARQYFNDMALAVRHGDKQLENELKAGNQLFAKFETLNGYYDHLKSVNQGNSDKLLAVYTAIDRLPKERKDDLEGFKANKIEAVATQYVEVQKLIENGEQQKAEALRKQYKLNEKDYISYLRKLYETTTDYNEKNVIETKLATFGASTDPLQDFKDNKINTIQQQYANVKLVTDAGENELAEDLRKAYGLKEVDYKTHLRKLYDATEDSNQRLAILSTLSQIGVSINASDLEIFDASKKKIDELQKQLGGKDEEKEKRIKEQIDNEKAKQNAAAKRIEESLSLEDKYQKVLDKNSRKDLRNHIKGLKKKRDAVDTSTKKGQKEYEAYQAQIKEGNQKLAEDFEATALKAAQAFSGAADLWTQFGGDEETGKRLEQFAGVASGAARIASGDIVGGSIEVLKSAFTIEVESDTKKFEEKVRELEKMAEDLEYNVSKAFGQNETTSRGDKITNLIDQQKELNNAINAEEKARKKTKFLGLTVGDKGSGSGTSQEKLDELEEKLKATKREAEAVQDEINELLTGTSKATIADELLAGFKEGKIAAKDFTSTFEDLMKNALIDSFKLQYLKKVSEKFFKEFAKAADSDNDKKFDLNAGEIKQLSSSLKSDLNEALQGLKSFESILAQADIEGGLFGEAQEEEQKGLAGGIKSITEDTANVLAGTINSIRIDIKNGLDIATQSSEYLSQIAVNTAFNKNLERLETIELKLTSIDDSLSA